MKLNLQISRTFWVHSSSSDSTALTQVIQGRMILLPVGARCVDCLPPDSVIWVRHIFLLTQLQYTICTGSASGLACRHSVYIVIDPAQYARDIYQLTTKSSNKMILDSNQRLYGMKKIVFMFSLTQTFGWDGLCEMGWRINKICCFFFSSFFYEVAHRQYLFFLLSLQNIIAEHEIRNISCAAQDPEDLSTFAYITKDLKSSHHYCHVFTAFDVVSPDTHWLCLIFIVPITSHSLWFSCLFAFTFLSEFGVWNYPDTWPGLRGGLPAGPSGQEERPRIVHAAWELRQQA